MATARDDSRDQSVVFVSGVNFGDPTAVGRDPVGLHQVFIGGRPCESVQWLSDSALRCFLSGVFIVNSYAISVTVEGVNSTGSVATTMVCPTGYYGHVEELCLLCPLGARCPGFGADPLALVRVLWLRHGGGGAALYPAVIGQTVAPWLLNLLALRVACLARLCCSRVTIPWAGQSLCGVNPWTPAVVA
jgi:hypothetical protein